MSFLDRSNTEGLDIQTLKNYQAAYSYYQLKQYNFQLFWNEKVKKKEYEINDELQEGVLQELSDMWQEIYSRVISSFSTSNSIVTAKVQPSKAKYKYPINKEIVAKLREKYRGLYDKKESNKEEKGLALKQSLGDDYEEFILSYLQMLLGKEFNNLVAKTGQNIKTSGLGIRTGGRQIISDIVISNAEKTPYDNRTLSGAIEVQYNTNLIRDNNLTRYVESGAYSDAHRAFGIAAKNWLSGKENDVFTSASRVGAELNDKFKNSITQKGGPQARSWNKIFAQSTANLHVSARIIDLLGPANVLVAMGKKFIWMSDFINDRFFYMNLYAKKVRQNNEILDITASEKGTIHIRRKGVQSFISKENSEVLHGLILPNIIEEVDLEQQISI